MTTKVCTACAEEKPTAEFYRTGRTRRGICRKCYGLQTKKYADDNPEATARRHRIKHMRRRYGMSEDEYMAKLSAQEGRCAICSEPFVEGRGPRSLCIDHNKTTGKNRDLLCRHCNFAIGLAGENVVILHRMIDYIDRHAGFNF